TAVAEGRRRAAEELAVELRGRHVADDRAARADRLAVPGTHAAGERAGDAGAGLARPALLADVRDERIGEPRAAAAGDRHAALLHGDRDHLRHVPGRR